MADRRQDATPPPVQTETGFLQPFTCSHCSGKLVYLILVTRTLKYFARRHNSGIFIIMLDFNVILAILYTEGGSWGVYG